MAAIHAIDLPSTDLEVNLRPTSYNEFSPRFADNPREDIPQYPVFSNYGE
jgi:hypothetical protein